MFRVAGALRARHCWRAVFQALAPRIPGAYQQPDEATILGVVTQSEVLREASEWPEILTRETRKHRLWR
jgi:hypothetical protein